MKLSHDNSSWKCSSIEIRDFRHTHDGPEIAPHKKKGGRKKWCKKPGEVCKDFEKVVKSETQWYVHYVTRCTRCHKEKDWNFVNKRTTSEILL